MPSSARSRPGAPSSSSSRVARSRWGRSGGGRASRGSGPASWAPTAWIRRPLPGSAGGAAAGVYYSRGRGRRLPGAPGRRPSSRRLPRRFGREPGPSRPGRTTPRRSRSRRSKPPPRRASQPRGRRRGRPRDKRLASPERSSSTAKGTERRRCTRVPGRRRGSRRAGSQNRVVKQVIAGPPAGTDTAASRAPSSPRGRAERPRPARAACIARRLDTRRRPIVAYGPTRCPGSVAHVETGP